MLSCGRSIKLVELLEKVVLLVLRNSGTVVLHHEKDHVVFFRCLYLDPSFIWYKVDGIEYHVVQNLLYPVSIALQEEILSRMICKFDLLGLYGTLDVLRNE